MNLKPVYKFLDADAGGDYFTLTGYNPAPSRYAAGTLQNLDTGESYWGGWLDADGCTPNLLLPAGSADAGPEQRATAKQRRGEEQDPEKA